MAWFRIDKKLAKCGGAGEDRLPKGSNLDGSASCVAYCQSCSNTSTRCDRVAADVVEFVPKAIEFRFLTGC